MDACDMKIPVCAPEISEIDAEYVLECVKSTWISGISPVVKRFEQVFSNFCDCKRGVAVNSGTSALHDSLATLKIRKGDEVIIPTFTMIATPNSIAYTGATPVLIDSELDTWNIDINKIEDKITSKTKAIIPVHTYGHPVDMDPILDLARKYSLFVIEDAAEAHGATYKGRKVGSIGDLGCFSFYANKIVTCGEGGMIVTNNESLANRAAWLRAHAFGRNGKHFYHKEIGFGYRMSGLQAALGLAQMERINTFVENRIKRAETYNNRLGHLSKYITFPPSAPWAKNVYWMYSILLKDDFPMSREELMKGLANKGIETRTFFYPVHVQPIYIDKDEYPIADELSRRGLNLPSGNNLTQDDINFVCDSIIDLID